MDHKEENKRIVSENRQPEKTISKYTALAYFIGFIFGQISGLIWGNLIF